jgi:hypothetical protein
MISIVMNVDTRKGCGGDTNSELMMQGTRSFDFMIDGVLNKLKAFKDFEVEFTLFVDVHEDIPNHILTALHDMHNQRVIQNLVFNRHVESYLDQKYFPKFNDLNFLNAMVLSRGKYLVHFDGDTNIFVKDSSIIKEWISWLDSGKYKYVSYPSKWSPVAVQDPRFDYRWASTRFFICKRETIDYSEILKCLQSSEYLYGKYGDRQAKCPWLEHILGLIAGNDQVFYPPLDYNQAMVFSWKNYKTGTLARLNNQSYLEVTNFVISRGGICYPCDVSC